MTGNSDLYIELYTGQISFLFTMLTLAKQLVTPWKPSVSNAFKRTFSAIANQIVVYETEEGFNV